MSEPLLRPSRLVTGGLVLLHAVAWAGLLFQLAVVVPDHGRFFRKFSMKLPAVTEEVVALSDGMDQMLPLVAGTLVLLLAVDGGILFLLRHDANNRGLAQAWFVFMFALPLAGFLIAWFAIQVPYAKLIEGLSK